MTNRAHDQAALAPLVWFAIDRYAHGHFMLIALGNEPGFTAFVFPKDRSQGLLTAPNALERLFEFAFAQLHLG